MTNRRDFIKNTGLATTAITAIPSLSFYISKNNRSLSETIVGHGDFRYRVDKEWGIQDPAKVPINDCHEMVMDHKGRILMTTTGKDNHNILVYDTSGKVVDSWGTEFPGAHGLTIHGEGTDQFLLITDPDINKVFKTNLKGDILMTFDYPKEVSTYKEAAEFKPTETAVAPNGDIYIADGYGKDHIIQYNAQGEYIRHFGGKGNGDALFDCAHGVTVDHRDSENPTLLITSRSKQEFKRFSLSGDYIETIKLPGCWICRPVVHGDHLYFAVIVTKTWDSHDGMIAVLDKENNVISLPGGSVPSYIDANLQEPTYDGTTFMNPHDVFVDKDENLYVPQWNSGKTYPIKLHRV